MKLHSMSSFYRTAIVAVAAFAGIATAQGAIVVSFQEPNPGAFPAGYEIGTASTGTSVGSPQPIATAGSSGLQQTFTVTSSFTLDKISIGFLQSSTHNSINLLSIYEVPGGALQGSYTEGTNLLATQGTSNFAISRTVTPGNAYSVMTLDLTDADEIILQAGKTYAFSLKTPNIMGNTNINLGILFTPDNASSAYTGGQLYANEIQYVNGSNSQQADFAFALYAVPETSVASCAIVGLAFFGCFARRRRAVKA